MTAHVDVLDLVSRLKAADEPFVLATVVPNRFGDRRQGRRQGDHPAGRPR